MIEQIFGFVLLGVFGIVTVVSVVRAANLRSYYGKRLLKLADTGVSLAEELTRLLVAERARRSECMTVLQDLNTYLEFSKPICNSEGVLEVTEPELLNAVFKRAVKLLED